MGELWQNRTEMLLGARALERLSRCSAAVFGLGGVGSFAAEALARCGVGRLALIDKDVVDLTNINRQLCALRSTVGLPKAEVMAARCRDINPDAQVKPLVRFYTPETADSFDLAQYDVILDAIDTVTCKLELIARADSLGVPVVSCMGAGNKLDPSAFRATDIYETSVCPLARVMRRELRARGIEHLRVVYSQEEAIKTGSSTPGSVAFVPPAAGLLLASEAVKLLLAAAQ